MAYQADVRGGVVGIYWSGPTAEAAGLRRHSPPRHLSVRSRRREIFSLLTSGDPATPLVQRVCELSRELLGVSGAGIFLIGGARQQVIVHATDPLVEDLADLQVSLGEGPCIEAVRTGVPVLEPRLEEKHRLSWQAYADAALALGVRATFTFPLKADSIRLGALDLYRRQPGELSAWQSADAFALCDIANRSMVTQRDRLQVDASIGGLRRPMIGSRYPALGRTTALDVETTVEQALARPRPHRPRAPLAAVDR